MVQKRVPLRKCTGCNEMKPKKDLIRVVKAPDITNEHGEIISSKEITLDLTGKKSGRGAYICNNRECFLKAKKARRFEKAFGCKIPEDIYLKIEEGLPSDE